MEEIIRLDHVSLQKDGRKMLQNLSLAVYAGQITVLAGLRGSGKHDIMRILSGEQRLQEGQLFVRGKKVSHYDITTALNNGILTLRNEKRFLPALNTEDSLFGFATASMPLSIFSSRAARIQTNLLCDRAGIPHYGGKPAYTMTLFEEHLLSIEKAHCGNLKLLILDLCDLDYNYVELIRIWKISQALREEGIATVLISDYISPEISKADLVIYLQGGRISKLAYAGELTMREQFFCLSGIDLSLQEDKSCRPAQRGREILRILPEGEDPVIFEQGQAIAVFDLRRNDVFSGEAYIREVMEKNRILFRQSPPGRAERRGARGAKMIFVPSNSAALLAENLTIPENLALAAFPKFSGAAGRIHPRMLAHFARQFQDLTGIRTDIRVKELKTGEKKLLSLYRFILCQPAYLVLDNPFYEIDMTYYDRFKKVVDEMEKNGITVICADKRTDAIFRVFDRLVLFENARYLGNVVCANKAAYTRAVKEVIGRAGIWHMV